VLLVAAVLAAQPPGRFLAESLGAADGLSTAMVYGVTLDAEGRVFVATERGVSRFDGSSFVDVPFEGAGAADGCAAVATLAHAVWAQCTDGVYHLDGERFVRAAGIGEPDVRAGLALGPDGSVWVAGAAGVHAIRDGAVTALAAPPDGWHPRAVFADAGGVWVGAREGLFRVDTGGAPRLVEAHPVRAFLDDPEGLLVGREDGLFRVDGTPVPLAGPCYVTGLARGKDGRRVVACGAGAQLEAPDGSWERFGPAEGLPGTVVRGVAVGDDGTVWLAVWKRGLVRLGEPGVRLWSGDDLGVGRLYLADRASVGNADGGGAPPVACGALRRSRAARRTGEAAELASSAAA
jgi:ligand-binding sensor domain-containing protein